MTRPASLTLVLSVAGIDGSSEEQAVANLAEIKGQAEIITPTMDGKNMQVSLCHMHTSGCTCTSTQRSYPDTDLLRAALLSACPTPPLLHALPCLERSPIDPKIAQISPPV